MRNKPFQIALLYGTSYIFAICYCFYGHYEKHLATVYLTGMAAILPLVVLTIKIQRDGVFGGVISGKEAAREGMKFVFFSFIFLLIFQIIFYYGGFKQYKIDYTTKGEMDDWNARILLGKTKLTLAQKQADIAQKLSMITLSAEIFGVFLRCIVVGIFSSFISAMFMKKN